MELEPFAHKVTLHQCLLGLIDQDGTPVKKATEIWASTWVLVYRLDGFICNERHKGGGFSDSAMSVTGGIYHG